MKPYYQDDSVTLYHGDCREVLPSISETADLLVTDPPYGVNYRSNWGAHDRIVGDDGTVDIAQCLSLAAKRLRRGRHVYIFGPPTSLVGTPFTTAVELIWDKGITGMGDLSLPWAKSHETITFATYEPSKANRSKGSGNLAARLRQGSVLRVQRTHSGTSTRHPTEKPVQLLRQLIESSSVWGETVLDPFCGVGSTLVAAHLEGRQSVGIEVSEHYCEAAATRLSALRDRPVLDRAFE